MSEPKNFENKKPYITVIGIGGAGGNAVNNMIRAQLEGVEFIVANTDAQALRTSLAPRVIQLGAETTQGLGAGSKPEVGRASAEEDLEEVQKCIKGSHMLFLTAGMGGGTGTGAAPVIAKAARDMGILTVGVVTKPFHFEGQHRMRAAERGIEEMQNVVDTLIVIPNQNLFRLATDKTTFADAFNMADHVLYSGVRGVTDLMIMPGLINLDFADVRTIMSEMGKAMMGTGEAEGEGRAIHAAEAAIANPLLDEVSMRGARGVLINITGGLDMTLFEVDEAANRIREEVDEEANIIFGSTFDERLSGRIRVSVVATGINAKPTAKIQNKYGRGEQMMLVRPEIEAEREEEQVSRFAERGEEGLSRPMSESSLESERAPEAYAQAASNEYGAPQRQGSVFGEEENDSKKGFFERMGLKRTKSQGAHRSEPEVRSRPAAHPFSNPPLSNPSQSAPSEMYTQETGAGRLGSANLDEDEKLDIPAFLRKKKPGA